MLDAARSLVVERGYEAVTMVQIAETAGVGRQTLYRWWPSKQAVIADCILDDVLPLELALAPATGELAVDLVAWIESSMARIAQADSIALFRALLAAAAVDETAARRLDERFSEPLRDAVRHAVRAAGGDVDADVVADALLGGLMHVILARGAEVPGRMAAVAQLVARGAAAS